MSNQATDRALWRGALIPSFALSLIAVTAFGFIQGKDGLWGALLGSFTVIIFFSVHLIINTISKNLDPIATMALAMFSYFAKVAIMGAFLILGYSAGNYRCVVGGGDSSVHPFAHPFAITWISASNWWDSTEGE